MTPELQDLGRRAVACKGWRWMEGMLTDHGARINAAWKEADWWYVRSTYRRGDEFRLGVGALSFGEIPDLSDPATLGCLLALVREAHSDACAHSAPVFTTSGSQWRVWPGSWREEYSKGATEAEALVAALEAAGA